MSYDFDTVLDRRATFCAKWDVEQGELPLTIADMDFATAPEVQQAILERAQHGAFGYTYIPDAWFDAVIGWWQRRHGLTIPREALIFCTGVIPAISSAVRKLMTPNENVLIQTPVYNVFFNSIVNNGCRVLESPLTYDGEGYSIDWEDLERKLALPQTTMMIVCNPHNPVGKLWDRATLARIGLLCQKHHVVVISDEIHCDLCDPELGYVPFASASDVCRDVSVTCVAPGKTFNLAGMHSAAVIVYNEALRSRVERALNTDEVAEPNAFAIQAAIAAYTKGDAWLDELRAYLFDNKRMIRDFIAREIPQIRVVPSQATYLLWLDCSALSPDADAFAEHLRRISGLLLTPGSHYGETGRAFLRLNTAYPRSVIEDALGRLKNGVETWGTGDGDAGRRLF